MTSPGAASAGNLHADIIPDVSGFTAKLKAELGKLNLPGIKVRTEPDVSGFNARLRSALRALPATDVPVRATPTVTGFNVALRASLRGLPTLDHRVNATPSTTGFNAALRGALAALPNLSVRVGASPNLTGFNTALRSALAALPTLNVEVRAEPNLSGFTTRLRAGLGALTGVPDVRVKVDPNFAGFNARLRSALTALTPTPVVKVRIDPDMTGFNARLRAAVAAMGTTPTIKVKIEPDLAGFGGTVSSAARSGQLAGGAYAATFRSVIAAALRNLPEPTIGAATGPAEQAIRDLRLSLERLRDERIGVTITAEQASREVDNLRRDIARLQAMSPIDIDAQANLRAAELALANMERRLRDLTRDRRFEIRPRVDNSQLNGLQTALLGSTNRMQLLITAGLALGPAIVPAAAAAAAAIGAIGGAAIAAGAGLGVGILALSGVVGAVKALSEAKNEAAKTNATLARQDKQAASGADQVRSAVASLANTRAQAASQARQSANAIADAERGLADAQRDALRAQQDITRAREDAKDALEDLNSSIASNATSIKQANLDLADAEAALAKVRNLPPDNRARIEAEIAYERAKQSIDDLTTRQGRLAEEKKRSDKAGIEGSQQVVAAQERISDAQRRVQDAERAVAEARTAAAEQARQSAFSIAQAQQAVVAAQRSVATSAVSAAATGGAAMDTLREKMANLSPEGRRFAEFIVGTQPALIQLRQAAEQALPGFQRGIQALLPTLPAVTDFIRRIAVALGDMGEATGRALSSDRLRPFFTYIGETAPGTLRQLGSAIGNVTTAIGNMITGFGPVQRQLVTGIVDVTKRFEDWSRSLDTNNGFQRFINYAITQGPVVLRTLGDIGGALVHILEASAPLGEVVMRALSGIAAAINSIPIPILTALLTTMTALRIATLLAALPLAGFGAVIATLPGRLIAMTTSLGAARVGIASFASALGGPVVLGIAAAIAGMALLSGSTSKVKDNFAALQSGLDSYRDAFKDGLTPAAIDNARALLAQNSALSEFVDRAQAAGISSEEIVRGLNGEAEAREKIQKSLDDQIDALYREREAIPPAMKAERERNEAKINGLQAERRAFLETSLAQQHANTQASALAGATERLVTGVNLAREAFTGTTLSTDGYGKALSALGEIGKGSRESFEVIAGLTSRIAESNLDAAGKAKLFGQALQQIGAATATSGPQFDALASIFNNIASTSLNATDKIRLLREALDKLYGASISQVEADENVIRTKNELTTQIGNNSAGFDLNTAKGRDNTNAVLGNRDALQAALQSARETAVQMLATGSSYTQAKTKNDELILSILASIPPAQRNTQAVQELVSVYGRMPDQVTTEVTTPGLAEAINKMVEAHAIQMGLNQKPPWTDAQISAQAVYLKNMINGRVGQSAMRKAEGGLIPGWSPHSKADNIPAWLTADEFVQPVDTVKYYGVDFMEALRRRQIPRDLIKGYASGGSVMPITIPASVIMPVNVEDLRRQLEAARSAAAGGDFGPGPGFPPWPSAHPGRGGPSGDSGVWRSIVALIRSTGPLSGSFGNGFRRGDPLWHGAGRALDWMGFNQDALAEFFMARRGQLLEFIHRTRKRDYAVTRGRDRGSFNEGLMRAHENHIHVAMAGGGPVPNVSVAVGSNLGPSLAQALGIPHLLRDQGGWIPPGLSIMDNRTGGYEGAFNAEQMRQLGLGGDGAGRGDQPLVRVDNMYVTDTGPDAIADELFWRMKTR